MTRQEAIEKARLLKKLGCDYIMVIMEDEYFLVDPIYTSIEDMKNYKCEVVEYWL